MFHYIQFKIIIICIYMNICIPAPGKLSMAAPMAVSSWNTLVEEAFLGSTVLAFLIIGKGIKPPEARMASFNLHRAKRNGKIN